MARGQALHVVCRFPAEHLAAVRCRATRDAVISLDNLPDGARVGSDRLTERAPRKSVASAGFGSPGEDITVRRIDLNEALIRHPQSTFVMRAAGIAMADAGIVDGDVLLVDRAMTPEHGQIVIAAVDGELVCRRLHSLGGTVRLEAASPGHDAIVPTADLPLEIWGVVTTAIRSLLT
jgi:DNA polymerase V